MIFVLDTTIGLGIWLPFTIGKTFALLSVRLLNIDGIKFFDTFLTNSKARATPRPANDPLPDPPHSLCDRSFC